MFIHLARLFRMVQTAVTIRTIVCITKTACLKLGDEILLEYFKPWNDENNDGRK